MSNESAFTRPSRQIQYRTLRTELVVELVELDVFDWRFGGNGDRGRRSRCVPQYKVSLTKCPFEKNHATAISPTVGVGS